MRGAEGTDRRGFVVLVWFAAGGRFRVAGFSAYPELLAAAALNEGLRGAQQLLVRLGPYLFPICFGALRVRSGKAGQIEVLPRSIRTLSAGLRARRFLSSRNRRFRFRFSPVQPADGIPGTAIPADAPGFAGTKVQSRGGIEMP